jgi:hypothetical protein
LACAAAALADTWRIELTAAGQAAAKAVVLKRADIGTASGWTGRARTPDLTKGPPCSGFNPKQSDLVVKGAAETDWRHTGLDVDSEAVVLQTATMVKLDWQRTVVAPQVLPCLRSAFARQKGFVSLRRVAFPQVATYTRALRALLDVGSGTLKIRVMTDVIFIGRGRTEGTLTVIAPYGLVSTIERAERRLARLMASRMR